MTGSGDMDAQDGKRDSDGPDYWNADRAALAVTGVRAGGEDVDMLWHSIIILGCRAEASSRRNRDRTVQVRG